MKLIHWSEDVIFDSLVWNRVLSSIKVLLHNWWAAYVCLFDKTALFESQELLSVGSLVHSLALWLSLWLVFIWLTDSAVVGEEALVAVLLAELGKEVNDIETHGFWFTGEGSVEIELEVIQVEWGS